jgi:hypothetical protein
MLSKIWLLKNDVDAKWNGTFKSLQIIEIRGLLKVRVEDHYRISIFENLKKICFSLQLAENTEQSSGH